MKLPEKIDRAVFWQWAVPLLLVHLVLAFVFVAGANGTGGIDTVVLLWLAAVLAARFKDIGWPAWIGASFLIVSMLLIPLAVAGYAIANKLPPAQFMALMNPVGLVVGIANLILLVIAGSVESKEPAAPGVAGRLPDVVQSSTDANAAPAEPIAPPESRSPDPLVVGVVIVFGVVAIGVFVALLMPHQQAIQASMPSVLPSPRAGAREVGSNGLTKDTNDFLRQLSQQPRGMTNK